MSDYIWRKYCDNAWFRLGCIGIVMLMIFFADTWCKAFGFWYPFAVGGVASFTLFWSFELE